ncbi:Uncharacterised protein [uncultured Eubacterium sp.]|nr:Uncharacterised protein [uncultured Eubacterium sp.]
MKRENKKSIHHILNLLIAVAFTMAFLFPACIFFFPAVIITAPFVFAILAAIHSNFLFSLRTVCRIE